MSLAKEIYSLSRVKGNFTLRSGRVSNIYFDKFQFEANPKLLKAIAIELKHIIPINTEVLAGLELGGIPIVTMLSQETGLPAAFIRKEAKEYGPRNYAEGAQLKNKKVIIIEDVVSSGGAILDAVNKMRDDRIDIKTAFCVIDRETGGKENLEKNGIELISLFTLTELEKNATQQRVK